MRALQKRKLIMTAYKADRTDEVNIYNTNLALRQLDNAGVKVVALDGYWEGAYEEALAVLIPDQCAEEYALIVARQFDQDSVCIVERCGAAYEHKVKTGERKYKGIWAPVQEWKVAAFKKDLPDSYTYDPATGTYWVVA